MRDCWLWRGPARPGAYGTFFRDGVQHAAHRFAWSFAYERAIPSDRLVLHACDTPLCVNPRHLRLGTNEENGLDKSVTSRIHQAIASDDESLAKERAERLEDEERARAIQQQYERPLVPGGPDGLKYGHCGYAIRPLSGQSAAKLRHSRMTEAGALYIRDLYTVHGVDFNTIAAVCRIPAHQARSIIVRSTWSHLP